MRKLFSNIKLTAPVRQAMAAAIIIAASMAGPSPAMAQSDSGNANITTELFFDARSAKLNASAKAAVEAWLIAIKGVKPAFILSIGHTDPGEVQGAAKAVKLSEARAEAVRTHLASKGIDTTQVAVEGKGDTQPVSATNAPSERAKNRRVDLGMIGTTE
jgi:OOP family OmpA-OmpF porin